MSGYARVRMKVKRKKYERHDSILFMRVCFHLIILICFSGKRERFRVSDAFNRFITKSEGVGGSCAADASRRLCTRIDFWNRRYFSPSTTLRKAVERLQINIHLIKIVILFVLIVFSWLCPSRQNVWSLCSATEIRFPSPRIQFNSIEIDTNSTWHSLFSWQTYRFDAVGWYGCRDKQIIEN